MGGKWAGREAKWRERRDFGDKGAGERGDFENDALRA